LYIPNYIAAKLPNLSKKVELVLKYLRVFTKIK